MLVLYVFWEITTVLSFLLVGHYAERATSRRAATQALLVTTLGGLAMLAGIVVLGNLAGTYRLSELVAAPPTGVAAGVGVALILLARCRSRPSSRCTSGCRAPWRRPPRSAPTCTRRRW